MNEHTAILFMHFYNNCFFTCFCQFGMHAQICFTYGCMLSVVLVAGSEVSPPPVPSKPIKKCEWFNVALSLLRRSGYKVFYSQVFND